MEGADTLAPGDAHRRVVRLKNGARAQPLLGRPVRPAAGVLPADYELGQTLPERSASCSIGTRARRRRAAGTSPRAGCATRKTCARWRRPSSFPSISIACSITPSARSPRCDAFAASRAMPTPLAIQRGGRRTSSGTARGGVRARQWILLRRSLANRRARARPADARGVVAAVLRARDAGAGTRGRGAPGARLLQARRLRHNADRLGAAVGRA